jgi:hypothetical protein
LSPVGGAVFGLAGGLEVIRALPALEVFRLGASTLFRLSALGAAGSFCEPDRLPFIC